jgi:hypothetical protein
MVKNVWEFDLFDFFSYIAPGTIAIGLAYPLIPGSVAERLAGVDGTALFLALVLGGYVVGHFTHEGSDWLRRSSERSIERRPPTTPGEGTGIDGKATPTEGPGADDRRDPDDTGGRETPAGAEATDGTDPAGRPAGERHGGSAGHRWFGYERHFDTIADASRKDQVQERFFDEAPEVLGVDLGEIDGPERRRQVTTLYHTTKAYLLTRKAAGSGRVEKFQVLHELFHSLVSVFLIFGVAYLLWAVSLGLRGLASGAALRPASVGVLLAGTGLLVAASVSIRLARYYREIQSKVLITEFYTDVLLGDRDGGDGPTSAP